MGYICMEPKLDSYPLFYDDVDNVMINEDGFPVFNIFEHIEPRDLYLFKHYKEYMIVRSKKNKNSWVELIWPEHDES